MPPRQYDGATILALISIFLAGVIFGSIWFGHQNEQPRIASNDAIAAEFLDPKLLNVMIYEWTAQSER